MRAVSSVRQRGPRGPMGAPSGPLGSGSVTAATISNSAAEKSAILTKLGGARLLNPLDYPYSAAGNGSSNDRAALIAADAAGPAIITANHRISSSMTFTRRPVFLLSGRLTIDSGATVTFEQDYDADETRIFFGAGSVAGLRKTNVAHFAGDLIGVASDSVPLIQKAYNAIVDRGVVEWPAGDLYSDGDPIIAEKGQHSIGKGPFVSRLLWLTAKANGIHCYGVEGPVVEGIGFAAVNPNILATSGTAVLMGVGAPLGVVKDVRMERGFIGGDNVNCPGTLWENVKIFAMTEIGKRAIGSDNVSDIKVVVSAFSSPVDLSSTAGFLPGEPVIFSNGANGTYLFGTSSTRGHIVINDILPVAGNTATGATSGTIATVSAVHTPHRLGALRLENRCELYRATNSTYAGGRFYLTITAATNAYGSRPYACRFTACDFDSAHEGMVIEKCDDITFSNSYIYTRAGYAVSLQSTCRRVNFNSTTIMASWLEAIFAHAGSVSCGFVNGKIVGANRSNTGAPAVTLEAGAGFRLTGNEISGPNGYGGTPVRPWVVGAGTAVGLRIGDNNTAGCANPVGEDNSTGSSKLITADYQ